MTASLGWLTPFSARSDVGAFSRNLLGELSRAGPAAGVRTTVLVDPNGPAYWSDLPMLRLGDAAVDRELVEAFDWLVFNIGNNQENHRNINRLALSVPGVVVVHDLVMQHYLAWETREDHRRPDLYAQLLCDHYGRAGADVLALSQISSRGTAPVYAPWDSVHVGAMPLIEPFVQAAAAVVVHSHFAERIVQAAFDGPVLRLQLPHDQKPAVAEDAWQAWAGRSATRTTCELVAFGHIGRNKCLDLAVRAFAGSAVLRDRARLTIAGVPGDTGYLSEIRALIARAGLGSRVAIELDISAARLLELKEMADGFINLRHPNTESASGSLNEQLDAGKPVVLFPTASYAEVDPNGAVRVDPAGGLAALTAALERLVLDPAARVRVGARGREWVRRVGRADYVAALLSFLERNAPLLRARRAFAARRRAAFVFPPPLPAAGGEHAGARWLDGLARSRAFLAGLDDPSGTVDPHPFRVWPSALLARFVALGIFGEPGGSLLEQRLTRLVPRVARHVLFAAVAEAQAIWSLARKDPAEATPRDRLVLAAPALHPVVWECLGALSPDRFVACCYLGLLGRAAGHGETAEGPTQAVAGEPARTLVERFLASAEFAARPAPADAVAALVAWAADNRPDAEAPLPRLDLESGVEFSSRVPECAGFLVSGWHHLEPDGVWSRNRASAIGFRLTPPAPMAEADPTAMSAAPVRLAGTRVTVTGRFPAVQETGPRLLRIRRDGTVIHEQGVDSGQWFDTALILRAAEDDGGAVVLEFDTGHTVNMRRDGYGLDGRDLGFCLRSLRVAGVTDTAEAAALAPEPPPDAPPDVVPLKEGVETEEVDARAPAAG